jgi:hypothetical protein
MSKRPDRLSKKRLHRKRELAQAKDYFSSSPSMLNRLSGRLYPNLVTEYVVGALAVGVVLWAVVYMMDPNQYHGPYSLAFLVWLYYSCVSSGKGFTTPIHASKQDLRSITKNTGGMCLRCFCSGFGQRSPWLVLETPLVQKRTGPPSPSPTPSTPALWYNSLAVQNWPLKKARLHLCASNVSISTGLRPLPPGPKFSSAKG